MLLFVNAFINSWLALSIFNEGLGFGCNLKAH